MTNLFLHIGSAKTATSSIQSHLSENNKRLKKSGYCYPVTGQSGFAHHHIAGKLRPDLDTRFSTDSSYEKLLRKTFFESRKCDNIILSSEALWPQETIDASRLSDFLSRFDTTTIIAYIRRQDSYAVAFFNSWVRFRLTPDAPEFATYCQTTNLDFFDNITNWQRMAGQNCKFIVRPFVKKVWKNGRILDDFIDCIDPSLSLPVQYERENESAPLASTELFRHINKDDLPNRDNLRYLLEKWSRDLPAPPNTGYLTNEVQSQILQRYEDSNYALANQFWTQDEFAAFRHDHVPTFQNPYSGPTLEQVAIIISKLWKKTDR